MTRPFRLTVPVAPETELQEAVAQALDLLLLPLDGFPTLKGQVCRHCRQWKEWSQFSKAATMRFGHDHRCKDCTNTAQLELRQRRRDSGSALAIRDTIIAANGTKRCPRCKGRFPISQFGRERTASDGTCRMCSACSRSKQSEEHQQNPLWKMRQKARHRAKEQGVPFSLAMTDLPPIPEFCPVIPGLRLEVGTGAQSEGSPSLDRLRPEAGYVPGNVFIISWLANRCKNTCTDPAVFEAIAAYLRRELLQ